ncbi:hypothetical protein C2845_PM17G02260 [Panicum miliaceum]|uniref:Uncharacterized protein n=1 Tax=Panicum miliaceum TaxID=4540 RepID=A0A3L6Q1P7_PANMI|nr:hypothetical protein C2845_PM17G02260 [Panicum miliaceum]
MSISKTHRDDVERLEKLLKDTDVQLVECMKQIKLMAEEKVSRQKELKELQEDA